jgi:phosphatidate cytidylyltransferase
MSDVKPASADATEPSVLASAAARFDKRDLTTRAVTAALGAAGAATLIVLGPWGLLIVCLILSVGGVVEFYRNVGIAWNAPHTLISVGAAAYGWWLVAGEQYWSRFEASPGGLYPFLALVPLLLITLLYRRENSQPFQTFGYLLLGLVYVAVPFLLLYAAALNADGLFVGQDNRYSWQIPMGVFFCVWSADIAAYFVGKVFGKHKLFPSISPKKTWEGVAGSVVMLLAMALWLNWAWPQRYDWFGVAAIVGVVGTYGDLVESMLKRSVGVKDSGGLLPGHGGILDRFDAFLLAMPMVFWYMFWQ